jgi:hypothetical protein
MRKEELEAIISSGLLENFILGTASPEEEAYIIELKAKYPEIAGELLKLELTIEQVVQKQAVKVPTELAESILQKTIGEVPLNSSTGNSIPKTKNTTYFQSLSLVLGLLSIITIAYALYVNKSSSGLKSELESTQISLAALDDDCTDIARTLVILTDPRTEKITLASTKEDLNTSAFVWYNEDLDQVILNGKNLPEINENLSFQLWAIINGVPSDMGVIEWNDESKIIKVNFKGKPQAFAITIEPLGGSENPTLDQLIVIGELAS